jgi:hypothetical protein
MRDDTVYGLVHQLEAKINQVAQQGQQIVQFIQNFQQAIRLDSTGKEIRLLAIQRLLIKKNNITEAEMTEMSGEIIKEMQKEAEDAAAKAAAPEIIVPTTQQVQQVAATPVDAAVVPPQA